MTAELLIVWAAVNVAFLAFMAWRTWVTRDRVIEDEYADTELALWERPE